MQPVLTDPSNLETLPRAAPTAARASAKQRHDEKMREYDSLYPPSHRYSYSDYASLRVMSDNEVGSAEADTADAALKRGVGACLHDASARRVLSYGRIRT